MFEEGEQLFMAVELRLELIQFSLDGGDGCGVGISVGLVGACYRTTST
jgi:hypothetical protein